MVEVSSCFNNFICRVSGNGSIFIFTDVSKFKYKEQKQFQFLMRLDSQSGIKYENNKIKSYFFWIRFNTNLQYSSLQTKKSAFITVIQRIN